VHEADDRDATASPKAEKSNAETQLNKLNTTLELRRQLFDQHIPVLKSKGWDLDAAALETRAGVRALIPIQKKQSVNRATT
jgi:hypothetical protein